MMFLVSMESVGSDAELSMHRTLQDAESKFYEQVRLAYGENDRECSVFLYVIDDRPELPNVHVSHDRSRGFREWFGRWDSHWKDAADWTAEEELANRVSRDD
jgi:hypothetical protein